MTKSKHRTARKCLALALFLGGMTSQAGAIVPGDYDGDGTADLAVAQVNRSAGTTTWFTQLTGKATPLGFQFGAAADAMVTGNFFKGDNRVFPGIVRVVNLQSPLKWTIKSPSGADISLEYGLPGDTIPNQGDLDCDGVADLVVARNGAAGTPFAGFKLWYVAQSGRSGLVQQLLFGLAGDKIGVADLDGDGCSELIALRNDFTWYSRKLFSAGEVVNAVQWGLPGDVALLPADFTGDGLAEYVVTRNFGGQMYGMLRLPNGELQMNPLGSSTAVPLVGRFVGVNWYAWLERATGFIGIAQFGGYNVVLPFGLPTNHFIRPDGTVVEPLVSQVPPSTQTVSTGGDDGDGDNDSVRCDASIKRNDGSGGFKNNPKNSRGTIKVMFPKVPFTGNIRSVKAYSRGELYDTLASGSSLEWGDRERYYGKKSLRSYPHNLLIRVELNNGKFYCTTLEDPTKVYE